MAELQVKRAGHILSFRWSKFELFPNPPLYSIHRDGEMLFSTEDKIEGLETFTAWLRSNWLYRIPRSPKREVQS